MKRRQKSEQKTLVLLPFVCIKAIAQALSAFAPELGPLANSCSRLHSVIRRCYCRHCGRVLQHGQPYKDDRNTGRVAHPYDCDLPYELDPFRWVYPFLEWNHSFVAGGWAAFLHYREHLQYDNCWRTGGEISQRDLDVFYYNRQVAHVHANRIRWSVHYLPFQRKDDGDEKEFPLQLVQMLECPSHWDRKVGRMNTTNDARSKMLLCRRSHPSTRFAVDFVGSFCQNLTPLQVLSEFDFAPCCVGFQFDTDKQSRIWILHERHLLEDPTAELKKQQPPYPNSANTQQNKPQKTRLEDRLDKYRARGYEVFGNCTSSRKNVCSCFDVSDKKKE